MAAWTRVQLADGRVEAGVLHTVDPETGNAVLLRPTARGNRIVSPVVLFGHAIASVVQDGIELDPLDASPSRRWLHARVSSSAFLRTERHLSDDREWTPEAISLRRAALLELLHERRIPVSQEHPSELLVLGCVRIRAPYVIGSCACENEIVLGRFAAILAELG
ncbi:hypothetical protein AB1Y20_000477 [Prymnesium parvum]|uniref:AD domain-containing protein n=1 Tax=Prymnesium parvum TaxID=97485 RepID=A0AB34K8N0_PRYPA